MLETAKLKGFFGKNQINWHENINAIFPAFYQQIYDIMHSHRLVKKISMSNKENTFMRSYSKQTKIA